MKLFVLKSGKTKGIATLLFIAVIFTLSCKKTKTDASGVTVFTDHPSEMRTSSIDSGVLNRLIPPASVSASYSTSLNPFVSDDFNGASVDMNQWQYRTDGTSEWSTSSSNVYIASEGSDRFASIKGNYAEQKGSGISSKQVVKYGFYITKWRIAGINDDSPNGWHPAIWGAGCDFSGSGNGNCIPEVLNDGHRLEIDFIEGFQSGTKTYWNSHILLWYQSSIYQNINFKGNTYIWPRADQWSTMGIEYTPTYMRLWRYSLGSWSILKTIPITTAGSSDSNMNVAYRTPVYWVLSNKLSAPQYITSNSWLHIDYFYLYDYIGSE